MGTCYSKSSPGNRTALENKTSKQKTRNTDRNNKQNDEELSPEKVPLKGNEKYDSPNTETSRSPSYDIMPDISYVKHLDHSIAPSDSGIESIGTWQDDSQGSARIKQFDNDILKHSEQYSLSFCHNCGHSKLQSHGVSTDSDILCCADQTEKPARRSQFLVHGLPATERTLTSSNAEIDASGKAIASIANNGAIGGSINVDTAQNNTSVSELKSGLDMSNSLVRDRHLIVSSRSSRRLSRIGSGNKLCDSLVDGVNETRAPLAQHDPLDRPVSDTLNNTISKQQALLNDISSTAETICACDYDADYHRKCAAVSKEVECVIKSTIHDINFEEKNDLNHVEVKASGLSRNSPNHREIKSETGAKLSSPIVSTPIKKSKEINTAHARSSFSESTSGVCTHKTASSLFSGGPDAQQGSLLHGSVDGVLADSSSECGECGTEDDMTSIDLDNISRLTSQSNCSSRQLIASSEHVTSPLNNNLPNSDDGEDCMVIPKETYHQMQTDLSVLRQQLLCLSSLIEQSQSGEQNIDGTADTSY